MGISYEGAPSCNTRFNPDIGVIIAKWVSFGSEHIQGFMDHLPSAVPGTGI